MKEFSIRSGRYRITWLLLVTASAVALTNYLFDPNSEPMPGGLCFGLFAAAWLTVLLAWRWHRPHLRRWSGGLTFVLVIAEILVVSAVRDHLFPCVPPPPTPQEEQYHALSSAVINRDLASVQRILAHDNAPDLVVCSRNEPCMDQTPLHLAVVQGNRQIAALLIDHGANAASGGSALLSEATNNNDVPMMLLLIHHGAPVNDDDSNAAKGNSTVLWDAVLSGNVEAVDCLLKEGANPFTFGTPPPDYETRCSVLQLALATDKTAIVKLLKKASATK